MPPLASDLVAEVKRFLYSGFQDEMNELDGAVSTTTGAILNLRHDPIGVARGTILSIDLEEMMVWAVSQRQVTVRRAMNGSTAATHPDGSLVHVRPKFTDYRILTAINDELRDLSSPQNGLYVMRTTDITLATRLSYELPADFIEIYEIREAPGASSLYAPWRLKSFDVARGMNTADVGSGNLLIMHETPMPGTRLTLRYKAAFTLLTGLTQDVPAVTGLPPTATDIPPLGAAIRLVAPRDVKRSFTEPQGEPRRAEEVPPGSAGASIRPLAALKQQRLVAEAARLQAMYPPLLVMR